MSDQPKRFADLVRDARITVGLRQGDVADRLGVRQPAVSAWEQGKAYPTPSTLLRLAELLELDVRVLLEAQASETEHAIPA